MYSDAPLTKIEDESEDESTIEPGSLHMEIVFLLNTYCCLEFNLELYEQLKEKYTGELGDKGYWSLDAVFFVQQKKFYLHQQNDSAHSLL